MSSFGQFWRSMGQCIFICVRFHWFTNFICRTQLISSAHNPVSSYQESRCSASWGLPVCRIAYSNSVLPVGIPLSQTKGFDLGGRAGETSIQTKPIGWGYRIPGLLIGSKTTTGFFDKARTANCVLQNSSGRVPGGGGGKRDNGLARGRGPIAGGFGPS